LHTETLHRRACLRETKRLNAPRDVHESRGIRATPLRSRVRNASSVRERERLLGTCPRGGVRIAGPTYATGSRDLSFRRSCVCFCRDPRALPLGCRTIICQVRTQPVSSRVTFYGDAQKLSSLKEEAAFQIPSWSLYAHVYRSLSVRILTPGAV